MFTKTEARPVSITGPGNGSLAVNRVRSGDTSVVVSWTTPEGKRQAASLSPRDANAMAQALTAASQIVKGLL